MTLIPRIIRLNDWLETHWVTPAYPGWVLVGLTACLWLAATNTLAGWLYVISGIGMALMVTAVILPVQALKGLTVQRGPLPPIHAGNPLQLTITLSNETQTLKSLLQVQDQLPVGLGDPIQTVIAHLPPHQTYTWTYGLTPEQRGIYDWHTVQLRTAAPLGLFWCRRARAAAAVAIVYPRVLPLTHCPLIDQIGQNQHLQLQDQRLRPQASHEGATRSVRPYRWGDPIRLVHWRTSARHNELRTRELEVFTGGQTVIIALDTVSAWHPDDFEQAVIAAASLYHYARQHHTTVGLWTANTGLQYQPQQVLKTLTQVQPITTHPCPLPRTPVIWLSQNPLSVTALPTNSTGLLWSNLRLQRHATDPDPPVSLPGLLIHPDRPLAPQLQQALTPQFASS